MSCAGRDKWVSVAEGIVEIWRCKELSALHPQPSHQKPVLGSVLHGKVILSMCCQAHAPWCTMTAVAKSSYTLYWAYLCHTPQTASPCPSTALWKGGEAKLLTALPAACCRPRCDSCIHLQWWKRTGFKRLQRFEFWRRSTQSGFILAKWGITTLLGKGS